MKRILPTLVLVTLATAICAADELRFESSERQTALIELYTSEGCSSCPPAEAWLSKLKSDPGLWENFVPLAFHVDYWDRLGWRDRFASRVWTARQYDYALLLRSGSVYTPQLIRDGEDWRDWFRARELTKGSNTSAGVLAAKTTDEKTFSISYRADAHSNFEAHLTLLGCGITSKIGGGENNGRQLQHDFVVLNQQSQVLRNDAGTLRATITTDSPNNDVPQKAVAIWITRGKQLVPLQAAGGWLGKIASDKQTK
jgi:hypothetical protein